MSPVQVPVLVQELEPELEPVREQEPVLELMPITQSQSLRRRRVVLMPQKTVMVSRPSDRTLLL